MLRAGSAKTSPSEHKTWPRTKSPHEVAKKTVPEPRTRKAPVPCARSLSLTMLWRSRRRVRKMEMAGTRRARTTMLTPALMEMRYDA
jgi:hypothetical protein